MKRDDFIQQLTDLIGYGVSSIHWIYGLGEQCNDGDEPLYYFDVCLQVELDNYKQCFISLSAGSYCTDLNDCIDSNVGIFEEEGSNFFGLKGSTDIDKVVSLMREYLESYADTKVKPLKDAVYFERM